MFNNKLIPFFKYKSNSKKTNCFLLFLLLTNLAINFIDSTFNFAVYDLTKSKSIVTLVGSISSIAFITIGLFAGIIVDAFSRSFFVIFHLILFSVLSILFFFIYNNTNIAAPLLFLFILINKISETLHSAANNTIFYDLCGENKLTFWISMRSITIKFASLFSIFSLAIFIIDIKSLFIIYTIFLSLALIIFYEIGYTNKNIKHNFSTFSEILTFIFSEFKGFIAFCCKHNILLFLLIFTFLKTIFIFWPMTAGGLFKFGIEDILSKKIYLFAMLFMNVVTIISLYFLGNKKSIFTNLSFIIGCLVSGIGIFLFSFSYTILIKVLTLSIMYIGLAISQLSSAYILRMNLPEIYRTQGLAFSVIPYYLADLVSSLFFSSLLLYFNVDRLLMTSGIALIMISILAILFISFSSRKYF